MAPKRDQNDATDNLVKAGGIVLVPVMLVFAAVQYLHYGIVGSATVCAIAAVLLALTPLVPRVGIRMDTFIGVTVFVVITAVSYFRGGVIVPVLGWSLCLVISAALLRRLRGAIIWMVLVGVQFGGLYALERLGLMPEHVPATHEGALTGMFGMVIFLIVITFAVDRLRARAEQESERLRMRLFQANKLESIARLAAGVAHDFNNLLAVISSRVRVIGAGLEVNDDSQQDVKAIERATRSGAALTQRLLAIGREDLADNVAAFDLNRLVTDTGSLLSSLLPDNVTLRVECDAAPVVVDADPEGMHQVLMNLAINSRDAMPNGGKLTIATANNVLAAPLEGRYGDIPAGAYSVLSVEDTGEGMSNALLDIVFEPFFTTKSADQGSGLGLAVVHGIVTGAGGYLEVASEEGSGTRISVYMPKSGSKPTSLSVRPPPMGGEVRPVTVLLVEDNEAVRSATRRLLKLQGHNVMCAENGDSALAVSDAYDGALDVLLTDMVMPGMSGRELAHEMKTRRPDIGVVFMSGYAGDSLDGVDLDAEDVMFLQKPASPEAFADALTKVCRDAERD